MSFKTQSQEIKRQLNIPKLSYQKQQETTEVLKDGSAVLVKSLFQSLLIQFFTELILT
jgi:hypothetical protein